MRIAALLAVFVFLIYRSTLLPGFDLGDSASFQTMGGSIDLTPRDGYPLYYATGSVFVWLAGDRAYGMNLASAVHAALACGVVLLVAVELSGSLLAAIAAALFLAGSYTFWSQSVVAEVYALHLLLMALTLLALLRWERAPTLSHLALFFALYAVSFGNHLSMILLLPGYGLFLVLVAPRGWRSLVTPTVLGVAAACAIAGALQYAWNVRALWLTPDPPPTAMEALRTFWFDVTKADWRETMVLQVPGGMARERALMYGFDLIQQFGLAIPLLAAAGLVRLARRRPARAALLLAVYVANAAFALGYNVGDAYIFLLPSHLVVALLAAPGIAWLGAIAERRAGGTLRRHVVALTAVGLAGARIYADFPALDRSGDDRPGRLLQALTAGIDDRNAILLTNMNWQVQNGLTYFGDHVRPEVAYARSPEVLLYAPALVRDNLAIGRDVALTVRARDELEAAYGPLFEAVPDWRVSAPGIAALVTGLPVGTRYVLCVLRPIREYLVDAEDIRAAFQHLTGDAAVPIGLDGYAAVVGVVGRRPLLSITSPYPFRRTLDVDGVRVRVRMESWLAFDTIRRMGFGHVIASRAHSLIVERGVSFVAFDERGAVIRSGYAGGIFEPQARFLVSR